MLLYNNLDMKIQMSQVSIQLIQTIPRTALTNLMEEITRFHLKFTFNCLEKIHHGEIG